MSGKYSLISLNMILMGQYMPPMNKPSFTKKTPSAGFLFAGSYCAEGMCVCLSLTWRKNKQEKIERKEEVNLRVPMCIYIKQR